LTDSEVTVSVSGLNEASIRGESVTIELSSGDSDRVNTAASLPNGAVVDELLVDFSNTINGLGLPQSEPRSLPLSSLMYRCAFPHIRQPGIY
jgi:hypothetical protein